MAKKRRKAEIKAVPINPLTGKLVRRPAGKRVVYGIRKGKKTTIFEMEPQRFAKTDLGALQKVVEKQVKTKDLKDPAKFRRTYFYEVPTREYDRDETGKIRERTSYEEDGTRVTKRLRKLKIKFKEPRKRLEKGKRVLPIYRKVVFGAKGKSEGPEDPRLMERTPYERVTDQILAEHDAVPLKDLEARIAASFKSRTITLKGDTIHQSLKVLKPPVSWEWLKKNNIDVMSMEVWISIAGQTPFLVTHSIERERYGDGLRELSGMIRAAFTQRGLTYTKLRLLQHFAHEKIGANKLRGREPDHNVGKYGSVDMKGAFKDFTQALLDGNFGAFPLKEISKPVTVQITFTFYRQGRDIEPPQQ